MKSDKPFIEFETERLHIRSVMEADKKEYMSLRINNSDISNAYSAMPDFTEYEWDGELNSEEDIYMSVFLKPDEAFVASASIQDYREQTIELGYDVAEKYRNIGIGTELIKNLLSEVHRLFSESKVIIRTNRENKASRHVVEKCGGLLIRYEDSFACRTFYALKDAMEKAGEVFEQTANHKDMKELMEKGKDSVCVYELP